MITSFNSDLFDLTGQMNATVLNDVNAIDEEVLKVHIPKIMPNIPQGLPKVSPLQTKGYSIIKNANKKPAISGSMISEKNFFETKFNATSNVDDLNEVTKKLLEEIQSTLDQFASQNYLRNIKRKRKLKYEIKKFTPLRVEFLNGKLNRLTFSTMDQTKTKKKIEDDI